MRNLHYLSPGKQLGSRFPGLIAVFVVEMLCAGYFEAGLTQLARICKSLKLFVLSKLLIFLERLRSCFPNNSDFKSSWCNYW